MGMPECLTESGAHLCPVAHIAYHDASDEGTLGASSAADATGRQRAESHQLLVLFVPKT
jgi:hypothetical protein